MPLPSPTMIALSRKRLIQLSLTALLVCPAIALRAQAPSCPAIASHPGTLAGNAYGAARWGAAEDLYTEAVAEHPKDSQAEAALIHTLLHEGKTTQAANRASAALAADPHSAIALTSMAEVQLRQGQPWLAMKTLDTAAAADPCYARVHLIRSRILRIDSMYADERKELQAAYDIDPTDTDILRAWLSIDSPAHDIVAITDSLATMKDIDPESRQKAESTLRGMLPMLSETSQTCQVFPPATETSVPLQQSMTDGKHVDGYRVDVDLPKSKARLTLDTAASSFYITKALADANGFEHSAVDPPGTVHVDSLHINGLEFRDCVVGVSDTAFANGADGFIGTDVFAQWLITIDPRAARLKLDPLPPTGSVLPQDRPSSPELAGFTPVYHRRQYLMVPLEFGDQRKLFVLATAMRYSTMSAAAAHTLSKITVNFTNSAQTTAGARIQFFRDTFDFKLGSLDPMPEDHILEFDPSTMNHNAGIDIAGEIGLDILQPITLHLDYRDGLVKFDSPTGSAEPRRQPRNSAMVASTTGMPAPESDGACARVDSRDRSVNTTIEAKPSGGLDSAHLKPGKEVFLKVIYGITYEGCTLDKDSILYGRVVSSASSANPSASELNIVFDHGDCTGKGKKELPLHLIGLVGPADESRRLHNETPTEMSGGSKSIGASAGQVDGLEDINLNPNGAPHTVHPGIVVSMPNVKLDPDGGPSCSAHITSTNRAVTIGAGSEFILDMVGPI
jgi:tetratricopeptide (TPR) repeat protein